MVGFYKPGAGAGGSEVVYGCTDPVLARRYDGVYVVVENDTDRCKDGSKYVTLWVDGRPVVGVAPGKRKALYVSRGRHDLVLTRGLSREVLLRGTREVARPFKVRYGCKKDVGSQAPPGSR